MGLEKSFDRAQSHRFSPYYGFTKRLHLAYLCLLSDVNLDITIHHRIHIGRNNGRNAVDCICISRQRQFSTVLVFLRCRHIGYAFLSAVTTTQRHQHSVGRTLAIEGIAQRTDCSVPFGSVDSDVSDLSSQWMDPTHRPRLHVRLCAPLGIPMNMIITTCGILCWVFSVMCKLAHLWSRTQMKLFWRVFAPDLSCEKPNSITAHF